MDHTEAPAADVEFLTLNEVAALLRKDLATLWRWRKKKIGPPFTRLGPRTVAYRRSDFDAWIKDNEGAPASRKESAA